MVYILLSLLFGIEIVLGIMSLKGRASFDADKAAVRMTELVAAGLLVLAGVIKWSFRWYGLAGGLLLLTLIAVIRSIRKKKSVRKTRVRAVTGTILRTLLLAVLCLPAMLFPQNADIEPDGQYGIKSVSYTWIDPVREETFTSQTDHRKITVQFWYPAQNKQGTQRAEGEFPLVIFSHGAFGIRASNYTTFTELATHGYVVCSIDHTYHSFFTKQVDGKVILCNQEFMQQALNISNEKDSQEKYELTQEWLKLRTGDINLCLQQIKSEIRYAHEGKGTTESNEVFGMIDLDKIGFMGHSLGGAAAADLGRRLKEVKAVAVIDGTMLGEETGFENGRIQVTRDAYPVPLLNFYNGESYQEIEKIKGDYPNTLASASQEMSYQIAIMNAGHMNFTDLAFRSPFLAEKLGTGTADAKSCMKYVNETILTFFDGCLKGESINLPKEQSIEIK